MQVAELATDEFFPSEPSRISALREQSGQVLIAILPFRRNMNRPASDYFRHTLLPQQVGDKPMTFAVL
jgi:hypothetical protein